MTEATVNDPCECGQTTIRGCADMPSRHCGAWEQTPQPVTDINALMQQLRSGFEGGLAVLDEFDRVCADLRRADDLADQAWKALPREFALSPSDGGGVETHHAIKDMAAEIERLRADNARLREALAPFAEVADRPEYKRAYVGDDWFGPSLRTIAFSLARKALEASNGK